MGLKENLKARRHTLGMTLEEVAKAVGTSRQTVQKYESGIIANIPSDRIEKLAEALRTTPAYLMGWTDNTDLANFQSKDLKQISDKESFLLEGFRKLTKDQQEFMLKAIAAQVQEEK